MLATEGGEHIFEKSDKIRSKSVCRVLKARRRQQEAHEIYKIAGVIATVVFADGALEAKNARQSNQRLFLKGAWSEQRANRRSSGATTASKSDKNGSDEHRLGVKKVSFLMQNA